MASTPYEAGNCGQSALHSQYPLITTVWLVCDPPPPPRPRHFLLMIYVILSLNYNLLLCVLLRLNATEDKNISSSSQKTDKIIIKRKDIKRGIAQKNYFLTVSTVNITANIENRDERRLTTKANIQAPLKIFQRLSRSPPNF